MREISINIYESEIMYYLKAFAINRIRAADMRVIYLDHKLVHVPAELRLYWQNERDFS